MTEVTDRRKSGPPVLGLEFATAPWFAELFGYLRRHVSELVAGTGGRPFSLCEVMAEVPPHISANGTLGWWLRVDRADVSMGIGAIDADHRAEATYAEARALALASSADIRRAAGRPARSGEDLAWAIPDGIRRVLLELHDHMASITAWPCRGEAGDMREGSS